MATEPSHHDHDILLEGKNSIKCITSYPSTSTTPPSPALIFTHGAGRTLHSDGILNFRTGFARCIPITCFQGSMNLPSRVKMFNAVIDHHSKDQKVSALGGRSMGARAAVMAAKDRKKIEKLVLVSYPLHTGKVDVRDEILMEIDEGVKVLFVIGDRDEMCGLERLQSVRERMKAKSWLVRVEGADHGMGVKPKVGTKTIGELTGKVVAEWLESFDGAALEGDETEGRIWWDEEEGIERWSSWDRAIPPAKSKQIHEAGRKAGKPNTEKPAKKPPKSKTDPKTNTDSKPEPGTKTRKSSRLHPVSKKETPAGDEVVSTATEEQVKRPRQKSTAVEESKTSANKRRKT